MGADKLLLITAHENYSTRGYSILKADTEAIQLMAQ